MPLILPGNVASATAAGYDVANSCRFNAADGAYMSQTWGSSGNRKTWTLSMWVKFGKIEPSGRLFSIGDDVSNTIMSVFFTGGDLRVEEVQSGDYTFNFRTDAKYRDPSAWQHFAIICDTTQGTDTNRVKIYHNGTQVTSFSETTLPSENLDTLINHTTGAATIGATAVSQSGSEFDGYMAEVVMLDGTAAAITDLGEFDEDSPTIWKPIKVSGLTFGTNGFYLDFEDSANLGNDATGGSDFAETNLAATDQATDTPTNNFCVMNPLANFFPQSTFSQGNCKIVTASSPYTYNIGTFGLTSGKWYWEIKYVAADTNNVGHFGISGKGDTTANSHPLGYYSTDYGIVNGEGIYNNNSATDDDLYDIAVGNIAGFGLDLDSGTYTLKFLVNGVDKIDTNISSSPESGFYYPAVGFTYSAGSGTFETNFGGCSAFTVSSANQDANGYGNFEYAVPSGYLALCTKNLGSDGG